MRGRVGNRSTVLDGVDIDDIVMGNRGSGPALAAEALPGRGTARQRVRGWLPAGFAERRPLLATAYLDDLQLNRWEEMTSLAERLGPKTSEDFLFLAQALQVDPHKGLEILDRAQARARQSPVGRLTRAVVQAANALETGRGEDAELALRDIDRVELADNPLLMNTEVQALLSAARAAGSDRSAREVYMKRAGAVATKLARFPDLPTAIQGRCVYYFAIGEDDTLLEVVRQGKRHVENASAFARYELLALYRRKEFDRALAAQEATRPGDVIEDRLQRRIR